MHRDFKININICAIFYFLDSDIEVVERPGETSDTPESETKELLDDENNESDKNES